MSTAPNRYTPESRAVAPATSTPPAPDADPNPWELLAAWAKEGMDMLDAAEEAIR